MFWLFALFRSLVGVGEASYSCVAPTIIGDLYRGEMRTRMLAVFIFAIPVGCGLGFILGASISTAFSDWRWALRVTPALGILSLLLLIIFVDEPERGKSEGMDKISSTTTFSSDILYLVKKLVILNRVSLFACLVNQIFLCYATKVRLLCWQHLVSRLHNFCLEVYASFFYGLESVSALLSFFFQGLSWWVPTFIGYALKSKVPTESEQTNDQ
jgi:MFS family permease